MQCCSIFLEKKLQSENILRELLEDMRSLYEQILAAYAPYNQKRPTANADQRSKLREVALRADTGGKRPHQSDSLRLVRTEFGLLIRVSSITF